MAEKREIRLKITDDILMGRYANLMRVSHRSGEFVLEFANVMYPAGSVVARVFMNPGHVRGVIKTLETNVKKYEAKFGPITEVQEVKKEIGF